MNIYLSLSNADNSADKTVLCWSNSIWARMSNANDTEKPTITIVMIRGIVALSKVAMKLDGETVDIQAVIRRSSIRNAATKNNPVDKPNSKIFDLGEVDSTI